MAASTQPPERAALMTRPKKSKVDKQSVVVVLRLTTADKKRLDDAAARIGLPVATAARLYALRGADAEK